MKIHLSRFVCRDVASNLEQLEVEIEKANRSHANLCIFPESFLHGYTRIADPPTLRKHFSKLSSRFPDTAFIFGSFTEERRNRMTFWLGGEERAAYDKVHLFAPNNEASLWDPGDRYVAVHLGDWTVGLLNCNDIRFPEQTRALRLQGGCDLMVAVGWWPWRRDHVWRTLLRARAMENGIFTAGCCISASRYPGEDFDGAGNHVFDPLGDPVPTSDDHTYILERHRLDEVIVDSRKTYIDIHRIEVR